VERGAARLHAATLSPQLAGLDSGGSMNGSVQRAALGATYCFVACLATADARAGDPAAPIAPADARCRSHGEGFFGVAGSDACIHISGYIEAGADFSTSRSGHDAPPLANPGLRTGAGAALDTRFDTPAGPARVYIEIGRPRLAP
jgi:Porin subfamily